MYGNVTASIERVTNAAQEGAFVYIHYSGHGMQIPAGIDRNGNDGAGDFAILLVDHELLGPDLASRSHQMVKKGLRVTIVLDCCFARSVPRQGNSISKHAAVPTISYDGVEL